MHLLASPAPTPDWRLAAVVVVLVVAAATASWVARLGVTRDQLTAAVRAVLQLAVVSVVIAAALGSLALSLAFVGVMLTVAVATSARRVGIAREQVAWIALAVAAGAAPVITLCLASGVIPLNGAGVIPVSGILIGGSMVASSLTGRRAFDELAARRGEYEAALALGLPSPAAASMVIEPTAKEALLPGIDQTRTVGLVTLPGAFVGVLLGGGTPLEAGATQLLVLVGLLAAQAVTAATLLRLIAAGRVVRTDLASVYPR